VRALLSVSDLDGLIAFARGLRDLGWDLVATDGTRAALLSEGIEARSVEEVTGSPALLGGRVKTLHPRIHAAVLARRDDEAHKEELAREGIEPIDLVAVNLYPFSRSASAGRRGAELHENIDIGGVALLRAGAKNYQDVVVVSRPSRYQAVLDELRERGSVSHETRRTLAAEAFSHTAAYDAAIASRFAADAGISFPDEMALALRKIRDLRYGENPHQQAAFYALRGEEDAAMVAMEQIHGKAASFNNILDINAAWRLAFDFTQPTVAIVKHQNPCGIASELDITSAYKRAFMCDSVSAFGGIVGANRTVTKELAEAMQDTFYEAIIAPGYEPDALPLLKQRKNLEIIVVPNALVGKHLRRPDARAFDMKRVAGGLLVQTPDETVADESNFKVVTERKPTLEELTDLIFAWRCVRHVTSNAIVLAKQLATVGVGPGQLSRVVAVEVAVRKAGENARLAVMSSDAYFPFPDGIEVAARAGVTAIIQPGGSMRDAMMIDNANKHRMAMLFTGRRHFKH
jgi:phosphoribosylaminoimidazolecarboxamide formyltransferase/IMP cyclohydrolase